MNHPRDKTLTTQRKRRARRSTTHVRRILDTVSKPRVTYIRDGLDWVGGITPAPSHPRTVPRSGFAGSCAVPEVIRSSFRTHPISVVAGLDIAPWTV
jgi:hypothetical protein